MEIDIAAATFGLVRASASGVPIAQFLLRRFHVPCPDADATTETASNASHPSIQQGSNTNSIDVNGFFTALLAIKETIQQERLHEAYS